MRAGSTTPARSSRPGAEALELNVYYIPADLGLSGREVEQRYLEVVRAIKKSLTIPIALKLSPFFSSLGHMARQLVAAGADGLVLFNRFYQPDYDLEKLEVVPDLTLSHPNEIRLPLLWIAVLRGRVEASLAATTGVHGRDEVVKYLMAGADAVMTTSALLKNGPGFLQTLVDGLSRWLEQGGYASVEQMKGSMSQQQSPTRAPSSAPTTSRSWRATRTPTRHSETKRDRHEGWLKLVVFSAKQRLVSARSFCGIPVCYKVPGGQRPVKG